MIDIDAEIAKLQTDYYRVGQDAPDIKALSAAAALAIMRHTKAHDRNESGSQHRDEIAEVELWVLLELNRHLARWLQDEALLTGSKQRTPTEKKTRPLGKAKALALHFERWKSVEHKLQLVKSARKAYILVGEESNVSPETIKSSHEKINALVTNDE